MTEERAKMYTTAQTKIACLGIKAGDFVAVSYNYTAENGVKWFDIKANGYESTYPEHHLTRFCL